MKLNKVNLVFLLLFGVFSIFTASAAQQAQNTESTPAKKVATKHVTPKQTSKSAKEDKKSLATTISQSINSQLTKDSLSEVILDTTCDKGITCVSPLTTKYYSTHDFQPVWFNKHGALTKQAVKLIAIVNTSYEDGLNPKHYHTKEINKLLEKLALKPESGIVAINTDTDGVKTLEPDDDEYKSESNTNHHAKLKDALVVSQKTSDLLARLDITLTDSFFLYTDNLHNGIVDYSKAFPYWHFHPSHVNFIALLNQVKNHHNIKIILKGLTPKYPGYHKLKLKLALYRNMKQQDLWEKVSGKGLKYGDDGDDVADLQQRLHLSGTFPKINDEGEFDNATESALMQYQDNMGLLDSGILDEDTLDALNTKIGTRIKQIEANMDIMRSFPSSFGKEYILVNIPEYSLKLINGESQVMHMDVAVGTKEHPSCVLKGDINTVVANPTWYVPNGIATEEVFPLLQKGSDYLQTHNIDVLKNIGNGRMRAINQKKVDWKSMTLQQFKDNYRFEQRPGKQNVLGKVKFLFYNPCQIYLHDSIESQVFDASERNVSHGCIRLGKPMELANYLLTSIDNMSIDAINKLFKTGYNKSVKLSQPVTLYIVYLTAWVSPHHGMQFRNDIYNIIDLDNYQE